MRQIIDYDCNFKDEIGEVLEEIDSNKNTLKFNVVSILGCQSTGKSTLLNSLFGTNFKVLDKMTVGYCQTTKGLWLGISNEKLNSPLLVWDVEGTDSLERGEDRITFENRAALFSLAMSDCMILNIPLMNLTTYSSSNFGLLKTIINSWFSLRLDEEEKERRKTTLLFAVRDITINDNDDMLNRKINEIMNLLWKQIRESQNLDFNKIGNDFNDVFEVKVFGIPSFPNNRDGFLDVVNRIRCDMKNLILTRNYSRNIPLESYEMYSKTIWKCIIDCEELNIPSQIKLITKFRCEKAREDIFNIIRPSINNIYNGMERLEIEFDNFTNLTFQILRDGLLKYFDIANKYDNEISLNISISLLMSIFKEFKKAVNIRLSFERQGLKKYKNILDYFEEKSDLNESENMNFFDSSIWINKQLSRFDDLSLKWITELPIEISRFKLIDSIKNQCIPSILNNIFEKREGIIVANYNTSEQRRLFNETLEIHSRKIYEKLVEEFFEVLIRDIVKELSSIMNEHTLTNPKLNLVEFWDQTKSSILKIHKSLLNKYESRWMNLFRDSLDEFTSTDLEEEIALQLILKLISILRQQSKYFHIHVVDRFKKEFELDDDDIPRQWIGEDAIKMKELFLKAKSDALSIIQIFKPTKQNLNIFDMKLNTFCTKIIESSEEISDFISSENLDDQNTIQLISNNAIQEIEAKSIQEISNIYSKAQLLQSTGKQPQNIPWWMYLLLIIFGFDEIMYILTSPLLITFLIIIGTCVYSYITGNFSYFYNYSQQFIIIFTRILHYITGLLHNSLNRK